MEKRDYGNYQRCAVPSCRQKREPGISFHQFPDRKKDVKRFRKWMHALKFECIPSQTAKVCSNHFNIRDFYPMRLSDQQKFMLKDGIVPIKIDSNGIPEQENLSREIIDRNDRNGISSEETVTDTAVSTPNAMSSCALGCIASGKLVLFDIPTSKNKTLSAFRTSRWKAILKAADAASTSKQNTRVCSEHFFLKQPAVVEDQDNPDWLPWLKLNPKIQDDPVQVQQRMQQYYEARHKFGKQICSIASCPNHNEKLAPVMPLYDFPALETSSYTRRVLSERRLLTWIQVIQQPDLWDRFDIHTMKICGRHFVSGQMAKLTDVENIDWIPTQGLSRSLGFNDHVAHFDLHNIVSLALEDAESLAQEETIFSDEEDCTEQPPEEQKRVSAPKVVIPPPPPKPQVNVGFKCILCLGNAALKPLTSADKAAVDELFKDKLCVKSELICRKCCTHITDFHAFHVSIVKIQEGAVTKKIKTILPVPDQKQPVPKKNGGSLFTICSPDNFQCNLCKAMLVGKDLLNKHLYLQHKVKINCKLCKTSFSPDGYAAHRTTCGTSKPAKSNRYVPVKDRLANTTITPVAASNSKQKYSCYICTQFFTPNEMREHIKTHDDVIKSRGRVAPQVVFDEQYEACKRCSRAVHKDDREKHQQQHDEERERLRELISKQQATNPHKCVPCRQSFTNPSQLQKHRETHSVHTCEECSEEFGTANQLEAHKKRAHDGDVEPGEVNTGAETDDLIEEDFEEEHLVDEEFQPEVYVESAFQPDHQV